VPLSRSAVGYSLAALAAAALLAYAFVPAPATVDVAAVVRAAMQVTVDDDGKTRVREKYVVSTPLAGRMARVDLHAGDRVTAGTTVLTTVDPSIPELLDVRARSQAEARLKATDAARKQAQAHLERAQRIVEYAKADHDRVRGLTEKNTISREELDRYELRLLAAGAEERAAESAVQVAIFEQEQAKIALDYFQNQAAEPVERFALRSPIDGVVLRVVRESAGTVAAGETIMEIGDLTQLEAVVDVLSSEATKVRVGDEVRLEQWGGEEPLAGRVRVVEPSGFLKVSALGVEEQRVNVLVDIVTPVERRPNLGDDFRVEARIVVWNEKDVLQVPNSALFRDGDDWAVFQLHPGRAVRRPVDIGRRNDRMSQVLNGLDDGSQVIIYPSDKVRDGVRVEPRT